MCPLCGETYHEDESHECEEAIDNYYEFAALYKRLFFTWIATGRDVVIPNQVAATMQKMNEQHPYWVVMADDEIVDDLRLNNDMNAYNIRDVT